MLLTTLRVKLLGEFLGSAFLLIAVVGSGLMAERLTTDIGVQLLINAFATAGALVALILTFAEISGARFNPIVTVVDAALNGRRLARPVVGEIGAQILGAVLGVICANIMFELPALNWSTKSRFELATGVGEAVATFGLLLVIFLTAQRRNSAFVAVAVAGYIGGAYFFTSSTSFANPAVTFARTMSDTFAGIAPRSAIAYAAIQIATAVLAIPVLRIFKQTSEADSTGSVGL